MKQIYERLRQYWDYGEWGYFILLLFITLSTAIFFIGILCWALEAIFNFLVFKFDFLITVGACVGVVVYLWNSSKEEKRIKLQAIEEQHAEQSAEMDKAVAENNYSIIRQCLFTVLSEQADNIGLVKPSTFSEMNSPSRIISCNGFYLCQFVVMKKGTAIDLKLIKECLQMRIVQKLNAGEFPELSVRSHIYNGRAYPILYIHTLEDTGGYIQINTALVNNKYCQSLEASRYAQQQNALPATTISRDVDF
ncbi:hypothetical protein [Anaerotignum propionicum]|uniref:Uncharacterized protein n=1 Tax=Anaerotignum propionicum DSM 1682 TaxID=991789 RepID=A0A0X8VAQ7_ANAPI|nr:hypothetical protein [Anaerotignum propionicum]AMJ40503.1 hypothetical protein CPRO_09030 [Anaerotignum propionicum DSM 1682]SHE40314.1 hypothetical protein SAMN02745151_00580 [[Clostridium] propionicum DSM 1682] [Anaerotignum propionicum DSM 1682]